MPVLSWKQTMAGAICDSLADDAVPLENSDQPLESDDDDEDGSSPEQDNDGQRHWWHVNKTGFPIEDETWERMWDHVIQVHPQGTQVARSIRGQLIEKVPFPSVPSLTSSTLPSNGLLAVQAYLKQLQYNHTGTQFFEIRKNSPLSRLMETAKEIIRESLPIKCLEAVVVALYLTAPLTSMQRFAISFKSSVGKSYYRHIVLAVHANGLYGTLGLSRKQDLMYKPLTYKSLSALVDNFIVSYENNGHTVVRMKLSSVVDHDVHSCELIDWKFMTLPLREMDKPSVKKMLDKYSKIMRTT